MLTALALLATAWPQEATVESAVEAAQRAWAETEARIEAHLVERATPSLAVGQNPTEVEVLYQGATEAEFEDDPFAERLHLLRIEVRKVQPAVGPASATFQYDAQGKPIFALIRGVDISGAPGLDVAPADELRVYCHEGRAVKLLWDHGGERRTFFGGDPSAEAQVALISGRALCARAEALATAVRTLALAPPAFTVAEPPASR